MRAEGGAHAVVELERLAVARRASPRTGTASWVRKQISSPDVRSAPRLRVRPWPNSSGAISITSAPARARARGAVARPSRSRAARRRPARTPSTARAAPASFTGMTTRRSRSLEHVQVAAASMPPAGRARCASQGAVASSAGARSSVERAVGSAGGRRFAQLVDLSSVRRGPSQRSRCHVHDRSRPRAGNASVDAEHGIGARAEPALLGPAPRGASASTSMSLAGGHERIGSSASPSRALGDRAS